MKVLVVYYGFTKEPGCTTYGRVTGNIKDKRPTYEEIVSMESMIRSKFGHDSVIVVNVIPLAD